MELDAVLDNRNEFCLHYGLIDCHMDICSPTVLNLVCFVHSLSLSLSPSPLTLSYCFLCLIDCGCEWKFADEFDYKDIRSDFVKNLLHHDFLTYKIHAHLLSTEYAAECKCLRTYDAISKDIIERWTYPLVPDNNVAAGYSYISRPDSRVYYEPPLVVPRNSVVVDSVVGKGVQIGQNTVIKRSVIGRNCTIGDNVVITDSYVWEAVAIQNSVKMNRAVVASNARILEHCTLLRGCILSFNTVVGPHVTLAEHTKVTNCSRALERAKSKEDSESNRRRSKKRSNKGGDDDDENDDDADENDEDEDDDDEDADDDDAFGSDDDDYDDNNSRNRPPNPTEPGCATAKSEADKAISLHLLFLPFC